MRRFSGRPRGANERGSILVMSVVGVVLAMISSALAVDLGRLAVTKRSDQKTADLAALDAARALPVAAEVMEAAKASATRNGLDWTSSAFAMSGPDPDGLYVCLGTMAAGDFLPSPTCQVGTAVRVQAQSAFSAAFPFVSGPDGVSASAVSGRGSTLGTVRVGSNVASLDTTQTTVLNRLLTNVLGGGVAVDGVGWNGIASGTVTFSRLRTALGLSAGSPDSVLDATFTYRQLLEATATALQADGSPSSLAARVGVRQIEQEADPSFGETIRLRELFEVAGNAGNGEDVANATFRVMDIVQGGAILADGDHFATATLAATDSIPSLGLIPNFYSAKLNFGLIEAPRLKSGSPGRDASNVYLTTATTSQIRVRLDLTLRLNLAGLGLQNVTVPYYVDAGSASASLDALECGAGAEPTSVDIWASTTQGSSSLGFVSESALGTKKTVPSPGAGPPLLDVVGVASIELNSAVTTPIPGNPGVMRTFVPPYTSASPSQSVPGTGVTVPGLTSSNLTVTALGLGLDTSAIKLDLVSGVAAAVGPTGEGPTTTNILNPVYRALGVGFGSADVWAPPPQTCNPASFSNPDAPVTSLGSPVLLK